VAGGFVTENGWMPSAGIAGWLASAGIAGIGARKNFGQSLRHEVGFLTYPLGVVLGVVPEEDREVDTFGQSFADPDPDPDPDFFISFLPAHVYYRYHLGDWQFETGFTLPLFELCDSGFGPFACNNGIMWHISGG
jgi:hypothetical protein